MPSPTAPSSKPEARRDQNLRRLYGITLADYHEMEAGQNHVCKICGTDKPGRRTDKYFFVDHCHESGKVRGLLCYACNTLLGQAKDSVDTLQNAIEYLNAAGNDGDPG